SRLRGVERVRRAALLGAGGAAVLPGCRLRGLSRLVQRDGGKGRRGASARRWRRRVDRRCAGVFDPGMVRRPDPLQHAALGDDELASTIFHELAHQLIYVKSDTSFNESFATFVQRQGLRAWRAARGLSPQDDGNQAMDDGFARLVLDLRGRLKTLYASGVDEAAMAAGKQHEIAAFRERYEDWRQQHWPGDHRYDAWVAQPINNARLLPFGLYDEWTPAFAVLFQRAERDWPAFYAEVRALAREPKARRDGDLQALLPSGQRTGSTASAARRE